VNALRTFGRLLVAASVAAAAVGGLSASAAGTKTGAEGYWIVLGSDRDGQGRAYIMRPDGSRLTPLLARALTPAAVSADGGTIAYYGQYAVYVSRADGTRLRRLARDVYTGERPALSHDGSLLAFGKLNAKGIWTVGTDGRGLRRLTSSTYDFEPDWSPDGKALVFRLSIPGAIVVQPLHGTRRVLAHGDFYRPKWSPDGRWIAYAGEKGLEVVRPDGRDRHRVARGSIRAFACHRIRAGSPRSGTRRTLPSPASTRGG
jgi:Tol biopolymer transport system component